jgi:hypothetical protein
MVQGTAFLDLENTSTAPSKEQSCRQSESDLLLCQMMARAPFPCQCHFMLMHQSEQSVVRLANKLVQILLHK